MSFGLCLNFLFLSYFFNLGYPAITIPYIIIYILILIIKMFSILKIVIKSSIMLRLSFCARHRLNMNFAEI
jgi:hypothetical protein